MDDLVGLLIKGVILAVLLLGARAAWRWISTRDERAIQEKLTAALDRGDLLEAADIQMSRGLFREAARIFSRANEHARAARALLAINDEKGAAESYEKGLDFAAAAPLYRKVGASLKAAECYSKSSDEADLTQAAELFKAAGEPERAAKILERQKASAPASASPGREASQPGLPLPPSRPLPPSAVATSATPAPHVPPAPRSEPVPPVELRFELRGELGRGGMGVVYRAHDRRLDRMVAIKFLPSDIPHDSPLVAIFRREAKAAAALGHPGIVTVYDVGTMDGREFIAMELVEGVTLDQLLEKNGPMALPEALDLLEKVLDALVYAHGKGIIHRDIKPSNLMKTRVGGVKIMDFGLAKAVNHQQSHAHTVMGGTPAYMPPEQIGGAADHRSDVFALGATFYELLTGALPGFPGQPACQATGYPSPKDRVPGIPARLSALIMGCLEHDRSLRVQDVSTMLREVREVRAQVVAAMSDVRAFLKDEAPPPRPPSIGGPQAPGARKAPAARAIIPREDPDE